MVEERDTLDRAFDEVHRGVYSAANLVTIVRLLMVPIFFAVLVSGEGERSRIMAFLIYAIAASTDWIDGQIARRTQTVTNVGKILDPLVDRTLLASGVIGLYVIGELPLWIPILLIARDIYLLYGSYVLEHHKVVLPISHAGKWTTAVLLAGFSSMIAAWPIVPGVGLVQSDALPGLDGGTVALGIWFVYAGIILSLTAAAQYTVVARRARNEAIARERGEGA